MLLLRLIEKHSTKEGEIMIEKEKELMHYGVLGMKWGIRRAKANAEKASNLRNKENLKEWDKIANYKKSKGDIKGYERAKQAKQSQLDRAQKYENKSKAIRSKHEARAGKKTVERVEQMPDGKALVQARLMGTYGALKYNEARAKGQSRGKAAVSGVLNSYGNFLTLGTLGIVEPRLRARKSR